MMGEKERSRGATPAAIISPMRASPAVGSPAAQCSLMMPLHMGSAGAACFCAATKTSIASASSGCGADA